MNQKINIDLHSVPQTLLIPLISRAKARDYSRSGLADERAVELVNSLNYDFDGLLKKSGQSIIIWGIARAFHFDQAIKKYLADHPDGTIVDLGAGLETTFYRIDNGTLTWVDLDLPEVIELRKTLLPSHERAHRIDKSVFDFSWMDDIKKFGKSFLFLAGGLFVYYPENQVIEFFNAMANHFPQSEMVFDAVSARILKLGSQSLSKVGMADAKFQWGVKSLAEIEKWSPHIKILSRIRYFKDINTYYTFPFTYRAKMWLYDGLNGDGGIIHIRFV